MVPPFGMCQVLIPWPGTGPSPAHAGVDSWTPGAGFPEEETGRPLLSSGRLAPCVVFWFCFVGGPCFCVCVFVFSWGGGGVEPLSPPAKQNGCDLLGDVQTLSFH